ncbi:TPA: iron-containing alcohol dehydrogenase [Streptococcus suis]|nr:iron-containing alcohol dehydrogenase [Streptococcus suis]HEM3649042.1 iron-containing alcohol dehydrogenase [Streptococcus suis]
MSRLRLPQEIYYGNGVIETLHEIVPNYGKHVFLISDPIMEKLGIVGKIEEQLKKAKIEYISYLRVTSEPTDQMLYEALDYLDETSSTVDLIVALGGGSCIDLGKTLATMLVMENRDFEKLAAEKQFPATSLPIIAIPTTAGTGSEVTDVAVITGINKQIKYMMKDLVFLPKVAIVDPELTRTSPPSVTAATGIDALCHALESFISVKSHPFTKEYSLLAIKDIMHYLVPAYLNGEDMEAREKVALASMKAGIAFSNASVTLVHGMSRPVGALFHIPHGFSNGILLLPVIEFSEDCIEDELSEITRYVYEGFEGDNGAAARYFIEQLKSLYGALHLPSYSDFSVKKETFINHLDKMVQDAFISGSPNNHPKCPSPEEMKQIYLSSW